MSITELFTIGTTIAGWCVMIGIYTNKIKQHDKEIEDIKLRQNSTEDLLKSIDKTLTSLNTKVDLLLTGKLKIEGMTNEVPTR